MHKSYLLILCLSLLACNVQEETQKSVVVETESYVSFNGIVMDVPDSIIQKYKNRKEYMLFSPYNYEPKHLLLPFYKKCINVVGFWFEHDYNRCISIDIENAEKKRIEEKTWCFSIMPTQDSFSVAISALTTKGKILLQKHTYPALEPPLAKVEIGVNRKKSKNNTIHPKDSMFLWVRPEEDFIQNNWLDVTYLIKEVEVFLKNKQENEAKRIGGANIMNREIPKYSKKGLHIPTPKQLWDKDTEYILLKVNGLYRKNYKDSLFPIYEYDSLFRFYPQK